MAQDDARENKQIEIFGLKRKSKSNRGSVYLPDATITIGHKTYDIELKTGSKASFSTARGMSRSKIEDWKKNDFFIFSKYEKDKTNSLGFKFTRHIICKPTHLQFFFDYVIDKVNVSGHAGKVGLDEYRDIIRPLLEGRISSELLKRSDKTAKVGTEYNDPKINIQKIVDHGGVELSNDKCLKQQIFNYIKNNT